MNDSMTIAAASMAMQQRNLETIAGNLSNISTPGFKASRVNFVELVQRTEAQGTPARSGAISGGVTVGSMVKDFTTGGDLKQTGSPRDLAINGRGFLEVALADGSRAFTRGGTFIVNKDQLLATSSGQPLAPQINVPQDATHVTVNSDGRVMAELPGHKEALELGRLDLVGFVNPGGLKPIGEGLYIPTDDSGEAMTGRAGEDGMGTLVHGALEQSNVQMNNEMVLLMQAQRAYELSARVLQVSDSITAATNELLRR